MNNNNRPHGRQKNVGSGSAHVGKGRQVSGNQPVNPGGGLHGNGGGTPRPQGGAPVMRGSAGGGLPIKLNFKTILIIAVVVIVGFFLLSKFGGGLPIGPGSDPTDNPQNFSSADYDFSDGDADYTVSNLARGKYVTPVGNGNDTVTIMVYMCGTDLESKYGMATKDMQEMMKATLSDKVNIIIETGGCKAWKNNVVSSAKNQIYKIENGGLKALENDFGTKAMTDPTNLTSFIKYCNENYPADRDVLIFWDHGGGSLSGYGYDEKNPNSSSMTLAKIDSALKNAGCKFDFIGFDACLMATLENALVCADYADYLIASEETEPGTGWYYTTWLTKLSQNTSMPTVQIAENIIKDYVSSCCGQTSSAKVTLSVVDLAELQGTVPESFNSFASSMNDLIRSNDYQQISNARASARQFSPESKLNQIDLADFADRLGTSESKEFAAILKKCVKYNGTTIPNSNGLSIYFPYETTKTVKNAVTSYKDIGIDSEYTKCIQQFASLEYGGQIAASASQQSGGSAVGGDLLGTLISSFAGGSSSTSPVDFLLGSFLGGGASGASSSSAAGIGLDASSIMSLLGGFSGRSMPEEYDWVDTELIAEKADVIAGAYIDASRITATEKNGKKVLSLTEDEWSLIQTIELNVFVGDGNGYIDLGYDNVFEFDDDGDLLLEYDGTWLTINGEPCAYYLVSDTELSDGNYITTGRIPALLKGERVDLQVVFDEKNNPDGKVTGAYPVSEEDEFGVQAKGLIEINSGDKIELLCDYYDLNGNYSASYALGSSFMAPQSGLKLENLHLDNDDLRVTYRLTDVYGNHFWIEVE